MTRLKTSTIPNSTATDGLAGRRIIVVAEPHAGDEVRGITDEPSVAEILAGAAGVKPGAKAYFVMQLQVRTDPARTRPSTAFEDRLIRATNSCRRWRHPAAPASGRSPETR